MSRYHNSKPGRYLAGVPCPFCFATADARCVTASGWAYGELCHRARRTAAEEAGIKLGYVEVEPKAAPSTATGALKLALWYIDTAGGIANARRFLDMAAGALDQLHNVAVDPLEEDEAAAREGEFRG